MKTGNKVLEAIIYVTTDSIKEAERLGQLKRMRRLQEIVKRLKR